MDSMTGTGVVGIGQAGGHGSSSGSGSGKCTTCAYRNLCLPPGLSGRQLAVVEGALGCRRRIARNSALFRDGQPFGNLYAVRVGHFMTTRADHRGEHYITGFHMAGELLGMDAIGSGSHASSAIALEDGEVCELPYARLQRLLVEFPQFMEHFHRILSQEIQREQSAIRFLGILRADERLASLLLNLSSRYAMRGFSPRRFRLRMGRDHIARYLGLTIETVSRLLGRFREQGLIAIEQRDVELLDMRRLEGIAAGAAR
ncbi:helix-turn-helix domain-containing protein [Massilia brevitalea]|uniref:helix-turn-helix domain-containing protein n=1 Tax=Massilia brevitalea TaxID=442526 RepID=UPI002739F00E|nr:helix-turn-helix domain-containing protein [Massilia brevitalea]